RRRDDDIEVLGSGAVGGAAWPAKSDELWGVASVRRAASAAAADAGLALTKANVVEVHDAFTIGELVTLEALGFCEPGSALDLLGAGDFAVGGRWAVNPSGGLLSRGHPLGATGLAQIAEVVWQLRGRAGERQQPGARLG